VKRPAIIAGCLACLTLSAWGGIAAQTPDRHGNVGLVLPMTDRVGDPELAAHVGRAIHLALDERFRLIDAAALRDSLRRLRIRQPGDASPKLLDGLAREVGVDWVFHATLHYVIREPYPQIAVSARVHRIGAEELEWAGFESECGLDSRRSLGRGIIADIESVAFATARRLIRSYVDPESLPPRPKPDPRAKRGYLSHPLPVERLGRIAVVPFDSVVDRDAAVIGEMLTAVALAELHRRGVAMAPPIHVGESMRAEGTIFRGRIDERTLARMFEDAGVWHIFTGTVETYSVRTGEDFEPRPQIAFHGRLINSRTGEIVWSDGLERHGWSYQSLFRKGRVYAAGTLAERMMESLITSFLGKADKNDR